MLYFFLAPRGYRKIFAVKYDPSSKNGESLCAYYQRTHSYLIPDEVEFYEVDEITKKFIKLSFNPTSHSKRQE